MEISLDISSEQIIGPTGSQDELTRGMNHSFSSCSDLGEVKIQKLVERIKSLTNVCSRQSRVYETGN